MSPEAARRRIADRVDRAGLAGTLTVETVQAARIFMAGLAFLVGMALAGSAPGRSGPLILIAAPALASFVPELLLLRAAGRRREAFVDALPDALDLVAVSVAAGRSVQSGFADARGAGSASGPLARELGVVVAEMGSGLPQSAAMDGLRQRVGGPEVSRLCASLDRSRVLGSPLADLLRDQASALRLERRRSIENRAAKAAPKIQLVVALMLVPSVMLMLVAALVANADSLLVGL